jgi:hypothetical protein
MNFEKQKVENDDVDNAFNEMRLMESRPKYLWITLWRNWSVFLSSLLDPILLLPLLFTILSLYLANKTGTQRDTSILLNIIATILAAFAGGKLFDSIKEIAGNTILIKKGQSAVRNLALARSKTRNISTRANSKGEIKELMNLLGLLEKDIVNSILEWNDIVPGVSNINQIYMIQEGKEQELNSVLEENEKLRKQLVETMESQDKLKELAIKEMMEQNEKTIKSLKQRISELEYSGNAATSVSISIPSSGTGLMAGNLGYNSSNPSPIRPVIFDYSNRSKKEK